MIATSEQLPKPVTSIERALSAATWAVWIALACVIRDRLAPHIGHIGGTNSDEAIVQLMANARGFSAYDLYYWGQERYGAWPFLLARLIRAITSIGWTCDGLQWLDSVLLFSAVWPLRKLAGRWGAPIAMALLLALVFDRRGDPWLVPATNIELTPRPWHAAILAISQPYGWLAATLIWAWWFLRRVVELDFNRQPRTMAANWTGFGGMAFLAAWLSPLALPFLGAAALIELISGRLSAAALRTRVILLLSGLALAGALVRLINLVFERSAAAQQLWFEKMPADIDWGHFRDDWKASWESFHFFGAWMALPISVVLGLVVVWRLFRRSEPEETGLSLLAITLPLLALLNMIAVTISLWGRIQGHPARYHALTDLFAILGLCAAVLALLPARWRANALTPNLASFALAASALACLPANPGSPRIPEMQRLCTELAAAPDGVLFGSYWGTYAFVDGSAPHPIVPVIQEMGTNRTEWTLDSLAGARTILVSQTHDTRYGQPDNPVSFILEYGELFQLQTPRAISSRERSFSRYANRTGDMLPITVSAGRYTVSAPCPISACLPLDPSGAHQPAFKVDFATREQGTVVVFFGQSNKPPAKIPKLRLTGDSVDGSVTLSDSPPVLVVRFHGARRSSLQFEFDEDETDPPGIRAAALLPSEPGEQPRLP